MKKNSSKLMLFVTLMLISIISAVLNIIFFIFTYDSTYLFISIISLFIVGITTLVLAIKNNKEEKVFDKYVIMDKNEYESMKNTLYKQEREIKKLKATINK